MAEVAPPPAAAALRRELEFVKSLLKSGRSVDEMMAAANAAARVAARAAEETKRNNQKGGTELTIRGLPTSAQWDWRAFKRWLQSRGLGQRAIRYTEKEAARDVGVVRFATEADCSAAADLLATAEPPVRGGTITVERGLAPEYANKSRKRGREGEEGQDPAATAAAAGAAPKDGAAAAAVTANSAAAAPASGRDGRGGRLGRGPKAPRAVPDVCEAVCPWWQVPYGKQLTDKHARIVAALQQITAEVDRRTYGSSKPEWVRAVRGRGDASAAAGGGGGGGGSVYGAAGGLCCPLPGILRAPALERYRNKSEFTAGLDEHEQPNVGFLRGAFQDGITCVGSPASTRHTSRAAVLLAAAAADYIRGASQFPVYDKRRHEGYWRLVLVREGSRKTFLPIPQPAAPGPAPAASAAAAAAAAAAPAGPRVIENPTFASLDPFTYLITFDAPAQTPAAAAAAEAAAAAPVVAKEEEEAAAAVKEEAVAAEAETKAGAQPVKEEAMAEAAGEEAAREDGGGSSSSGSAGVVPSIGMHVSQVSEPEPEQPPPDEVMVMLQVNPQYPLAVSQPAAAARELRRMAAALSAAAAAGGLPLSCVRVQLHSGVSNAAPYDAPIMEVPPAAEAAEEGKEGEKMEEEGAKEVEGEVVSGPGFIHDSLCELRFRISPTAFFQVNSPATCVLYKVVGEWAAPTRSTLLLDICCGTGTIGLTLAARVAKVVGVDAVSSAIEDARVNASLNGISNAVFVAGKAEDALPGILATHVTNATTATSTTKDDGADGTTTDAAAGQSYDNVVAVCDPPRAGLHRSVIRTLLGCEKIRRLVFVSCNPDNLVANIAALCNPPDNRSGREKGGNFVARAGVAVGRGFHARDELQAPYVSYTPFRPVKALAVDLFPHTSHVEAVMLLER